MIPKSGSRKVYVLVGCYLSVLLCNTNICFSQVQFPDPSPKQIIIQDFGMTQIKLSYARPGVKGRVMIGNVEPFDSVWRAGANQPTTIQFKSPVLINQVSIDSGVYAIYLIPKREKEWIFILNKGINNWGSDGYNRNLDVVRMPVKKEKNQTITESLTYSFDAIKPESVLMTIRWEDWKLTIPIEARVKEKLRQQIELNLASANPIYWHAAQFYYEYDHDNAKALDMINQAIARNEKNGVHPYWQYHYKARILKDLNRKKEAIEFAELSSKYAREHGNRNNYIKLNAELIRSLD
jgi:tetratricopeptide (TPR) repeat protein